MPLFHHLKPCYLFCMLILKDNYFLNWFMIYHCWVFLQKENFSVKILCIIVESTSFRRKIWPSKKARTIFVLINHHGISKHADNKKYNLLSKWKHVSGHIYQKQLCSHSDSRMADKVPGHPTVTMVHLCLIYPFTKRVALEGSGLVQWSQV